MLSTHHRAAHEPEREALLEMILRESRHDVSPQDTRRLLLERDARLDLEYDISWANQFVIGHLLAVFPAAKFIVLVRDCSSWLGSIIGHLVNRDVPPDVLAFLRWWFQPERYPHSHHDRALEARGLFSIPAYLHAWNRHIDLCTRLIPAHRRLILRTHELALSPGRLAAFLQIPEESIDLGNAHLNRAGGPGPAERLIDRTYLAEMVDAICRDNMSRFFPDPNANNT
ncbi:MAG: hypothetical protein F4Y14_15765 [Acidobacteria bacterium]|nr:hypothetical protein [Acidobacteriota bacterium]